MGRYKKEVKQEVVKVVAEFEQTAQKRDLCNQLIGSFKSFDFMQKLANVGGLKQLLEVKEAKLYKGFSYIDDGGKPLTVSTFEEFCDLLGISRQKINLDLQNLKEFGEAALESMNKLGLGYRDMRKLRQLDESDKEIVFAEVTANMDDKQSVLELIDDLAAKHQKEKIELDKKLEAKSEEIETTNKIIEDKDTKINELNKKIIDDAKATPDEFAEKIKKLLYSECLAIDISIMKMRGVFEQCFENEEAPHLAKWLCANSIVGVEAQLDSLRHEYKTHFHELPPKDSKGWGVNEAPWWDLEIAKMRERFEQSRTLESQTPELQTHATLENED